MRETYLMIHTQLNQQMRTSIKNIKRMNHFRNKKIHKMMMTWKEKLETSNVDLDIILTLQPY